MDAQASKVVRRVQSSNAPAATQQEGRRIEDSRPFTPPASGALAPGRITLM
jgi:hypothetical protein